MRSDNLLQEADYNIPKPGGYYSIIILLALVILHFIIKIFYPFDIYSNTGEFDVQFTLIILTALVLVPAVGLFLFIKEKNAGWIICFYYSLFILLLSLGLTDFETVMKMPGQSIFFFLVKSPVVPLILTVILFYLIMRKPVRRYYGINNLTLFWIIFAVILLILAILLSIVLFN